MEREMLLEIDRISKNFGVNAALKEACMQVRCGEIIGLVGENGAGKSTLLKIIMGVQPPTGGEMRWRGRPYAPKTPHEANRTGVGMVFQEQSLVTNLTVGQNIFFGFEKQFSTAGVINFKKMYAQAAKALAEVELEAIRPETYVRELTFAERQMVEIAKVVNQANSAQSDRALILLDEPTSVLNEEEVRRLYQQMRRLAEKGHAIIFVSHRLDEVLEITDRIYVFKDAANAGEFCTAQVKEEDLYKAMVGQSSTSEYFDIASQCEPQREVVLEVNGLSMFGAFRELSFQLHKGEILGFCGVVGSGKEELCYVLCGDEAPTAGSITVHGREKTFSEPAAAREAGVLMVPQERNVESIFGILSVADNIAASNLKQLAPKGVLSTKKIARQAKEWIGRLKIRTAGAGAPINSLSGGNAQKAVFARMLASGCRIVLLNHPTRGVDVGAKVEIYKLIREMVREGCSIILLGDTLDECIGLSNRILVMKDGAITTEFDAPPQGKPGHLEIIQNMM